MPVRVKLIPDNKTLDVEPGSTAGDVLRMLGFSTESGVVLVNGKPVPEDYRLREGDEVAVVRVLSGGQV